MGCDGPAIVAAAFDQVDFIPAFWPMLMGPQSPGPGVESCPLRVAMAVGPDLGAHLGLTDKGIVIRHAPVRENPHDFALKFVEILCSRALVVFTQRNKQISVTVKYQA